MRKIYAEKNAPVIRERRLRSNARQCIASYCIFVLFALFVPSIFEHFNSGTQRSGAKSWNGSWQNAFANDANCEAIAMNRRRARPSVYRAPHQFDIFMHTSSLKPTALILNIPTYVLYLNFKYFHLCMSKKIYFYFDLNCT